MRAYKTILIAGPTASGKSGLAMTLAKRLSGVIVNADSMQVYSDLRHVTARPTVEEEALVPHRLYGTIDAGQAFSTGAWLRSVEKLLPQLREEYETVIFVGGTGLYFNVLTQGLSEVPETPSDLRQNLRKQLAALGPEELFAQLQTEDGVGAALLKPNDGQRIVRALEVLRHTGKPLHFWQSQTSKPLIELDNGSTKAIVLTPKKAELDLKIAFRFGQMVEAGALDEVKSLISRRLDPQLPSMKAIGVKELGMALSSEIALPNAIDLAVVASRQYAKRQATWFRGQMDYRWERFGDAGAEFLQF